MKKVILIIILVVEILILIPSNNKEEVLKEVKVSDNNQNKNTLAIMLRGKDSEEYTPSQNNTWPGGDYKFVKAECMDKDGNELNYYSIIDFDDSTNTATITTKDTVYCYMYFAEGMNAVERIELYSGKNTPKNATTLEPEQDVKDRGDVLRRFQGTATDVTNNYICFGTSNPEECKSNADKYMYRIIGYALDDDTVTNTKKGQIKIIKKEALEKAMAWHNNYNENVTWFESDLFKYINNKDANIKEYLGNETYIPSDWENKIADHEWWTGDMIYTESGGWQSGANVYKIETGRAASEYDVYNANGQSQIYVNNGVEGDPYYHKTIKYDRVRQTWTIHQSDKVGLMNLSDYYLAYGGGDKTCAENTDCVNTWVHLSKNDPKAPSVHEWLMSRYGFDVSWGWGRYQALAVNSDGPSSSTFFTDLLSVRPVLYLESSVTLNGSGTTEDPFIITP